MISKIKQRLWGDSLLRRRLIGGALWGGVAAAGSRLTTVVASFFLAHILGQEGFGEYGMVNSTAGMIGGFSGLGIGITVTKHVAELKNRDPARAGRIIALSSFVTLASALFFSAAFVLLAPWLAAKTLAAPHLSPLLQISAITVAMGVINSVQTSSLAGVEAFRTSSYINVVTGVFQSIIVVLGAWRWGLPGGVIALALSASTTVIVTRIFVNREWRRFNIHPLWREVFVEWRVLVHFSAPTFLTILLIGPAYWACNAFLANEPNGYAELGILSAATQWQSAIQFIPVLASTALLPIMSERCGAGADHESFSLMLRMIKYIFVVAAILSIVVSLASPLVLAGYGFSAEEGTVPLIVLLATGALLATTIPMSNFIVASGLMWRDLLVNAVWAVALISMSWFAVGRGAGGLASARLLAQLVKIAMYGLVLYRVRVGFLSRGFGDKC